MRSSESSLVRLFFPLQIQFGIYFNSTWSPFFGSPPFFCSLASSCFFLGGGFQCYLFLISFSAFPVFDVFLHVKIQIINHTRSAWFPCSGTPRVRVPRRSCPREPFRCLLVIPRRRLRLSRVATADPGVPSFPTRHTLSTATPIRPLCGAWGTFFCFVHPHDFACF